jgi:1,4-dihydroxy-2-naphthoate octaprenyltransferase
VNVREKTLILIAAVLVAVDVVLPYTIFRKEGAWTFWIILTALVLAGGIAYTSSWKDITTGSGRRNAS